MADAPVSYLVFDIESVADGAAGRSKLRYPGEGSGAARPRSNATAQELMEKYEQRLHSLHVSGAGLGGGGQSVGRLTG